MRALVLAVLALLAVAPAASATCFSHVGPNVQHQERLSPLLGQGASQFPAAVAGDQLGDFGIDNNVGGWYVGIAPGRLTLDDVRAGIGQRIDARYGAEDAAYLKATLIVEADRYGEAELRQVQRAIGGRLRGVLATVGIGCNADNVRRVTVEISSQSSDAAEQERVRAVVAEYGDRARLNVSPYQLPLPGGPGGRPGSETERDEDARPRRRVRDYVFTRCGRRLSVRLRARRRAAVERVTVAGKRVPRRGTRRVLSGRRVRVVVRLRDGTKLVRRVRCGRSVRS